MPGHPESTSRQNTFQPPVEFSPKTRSEYLQGKTELSDVDIINILDLPVEKRSINNEIYTDKSYKELKNNPADLSSLTENLKTNPEYLKYHSGYIAKSKLLYQESDVLCNEIPCLIVLDQLKKTSYLLPYEYAANKYGAAITSADALKSNTFTDFKRVFNSRLKKLIEKGIEQGKDIFFLINNKKLSHDEIKNQLIRFLNNRTSENKEGTYLFFSEKDFVCYSFESDKNGFITELPEYDLKEIRAAISSKPLTPSRESEKTSDSLASNLNITQEKSDVNELFSSLLLRGEITLLERKKDIENRQQRYFNALNSLEKLNYLISSDAIKESNKIFIQAQKETKFYQALLAEQTENKPALKEKNTMNEFQSKNQNTAANNQNPSDTDIPHENRPALKEKNTMETQNINSQALVIDKNQMARMRAAREIKENMPNLSENERAAAVAILEAGAKSQKTSISEYMEKTFPNGIFGDIRTAEAAARQQGVEINGAVSINGFGENAKTVIYAGKTADFSTWCHELSHVWQSQLTGELKQNAEEAFQVKNSDWQKSIYIFEDGHTDTSAEAFAYGFEDFLKSNAGEMAADDKKRIFEKFADYMSRTYNGLKQHVKINEKITSVYQKLIEIDDNILAQAEKAVRAERENEFLQREKNIQHSEKRQDYIRKYYTNIKNQYYETEQISSDGKRKGIIEVSDDRNLNSKTTRTEIDALLTFTDMGTYATLLSENSRIGDEKHIDALLNHRTLVEIKSPTGNANSIAKEIKEAINKENSEFVTVFLLDSAKNVSDAEILEKLEQKRKFIHGKTDGIFVIRNGILSEIKIPRVESFQTRSPSNSNNITYAKNVNIIFQPVNSSMLFQSAYHGSSANFDKFNTSEYGLSGDGAMAFGYGVYVSNSETIARSYAGIQGERNLYAVEIPDSGYIVWDKTVSKSQKEKVKSELYENLIKEDYKGVEKQISTELDNVFSEDFDGKNLYGTVSSYIGSDRETSIFFRNIGYAGIQYPAGSSENASNYVIFDDNDIKIKNHFQFQTIGKLEAREFDRNQQNKLTTQMILDQEDKEQMENISAAIKSAENAVLDENGNEIMFDEPKSETEERKSIKAIDVWNEINETIAENPEYEYQKFAALDYLYNKGTDDAAGYKNSFERNLNKLKEISKSDKQLQQILEKYKDCKIDFDDQALAVKIAGRRNNNFNKAKQDLLDFVENKKYLRESEISQKQEFSLFDKELYLFNNGQLEENHVFNLGKPGEILKNCGFPENDRIELVASRLKIKARQGNHPFEIMDILGLDKALQNPIAVFEYGEKEKAQNVIVNLEKDGKNFLVGVFFNQKKDGFEVSSIRGLFNRDNLDWMRWIQQGKLIYGDKERIQVLANQQRTNLADVNSKEARTLSDLYYLDSLDNILQNFGDVKNIYARDFPRYTEQKEKFEIFKQFRSAYQEKDSINIYDAVKDADEFYKAIKNNDKSIIEKFTNGIEKAELASAASLILEKGINTQALKQHASMHGKDNEPKYTKVLAGVEPTILMEQKTPSIATMLRASTTLATGNVQQNTDSVKQENLNQSTKKTQGDSMDKSGKKSFNDTPVFRNASLFLEENKKGELPFFAGKEKLKDGKEVIEIKPHPVVDAITGRLVLGTNQVLAQDVFRKTGEYPANINIITWAEAKANGIQLKKGTPGYTISTKGKDNSYNIYKLFSENAVTENSIGNLNRAKYSAAVKTKIAVLNRQLEQEENIQNKSIILANLAYAHLDNIQGNILRPKEIQLGLENFRQGSELEKRTKEVSEYIENLPKDVKEMFKEKIMTVNGKFDNTTPEGLVKNYNPLQFEKRAAEKLEKAAELQKNRPEQIIDARNCTSATTFIAKYAAATSLAKANQNVKFITDKSTNEKIQKDLSATLEKSFSEYNHSKVFSIGEEANEQCRTELKNFRTQQLAIKSQENEIERKKDLNPSIDLSLS